MKKFKFLSIALAMLMLLTFAVSAADVTKFDFEEALNGDDFMALVEGETEFFEIRPGRPQDGATIMEDDNGGKYLHLTGYCDIHSFETYTDEYVFSLDMGAEATSHTVSVRGLLSGSVTKPNPKNKDTAGNPVIEKFDYYEWDWYKENGGNAEGVSGRTGGAGGIHLAIANDGFEIGIKAYTEQALNVCSYTTVIPYDIDTSNFYNVKFYDDGSTVTILINNELLATVELSEAGKTYNNNDGTLESDFKYFGKASVKDADGMEVLAVENTRVTCEGSIIAIATRNCDMDIDNISFTTGEGVIEADKAAAPTTPTTPDTEGETVTTEPGNNTEAGDATNAPDTATKADDANKADDKDEPKSEKKDNTWIFIVVVVAVVAVAAVAAVIVVKKKK